jgi:hypothetical protein
MVVGVIAPILGVLVIRRDLQLDVERPRAPTPPRKPGSVAALRRLAGALGVTIMDLLPAPQQDDEVPTFREERMREG